MSQHSPQAAVERALQAARCDDCVVIAQESSSANLRWAGNTLTTNGIVRSRRLTVIAITRRADGARVGVVSRSGVTDDQIAAVVTAAELAAAGSSPAVDAQPLIGQNTGAGGGGGPGGGRAGGISWEEPPVGTEIGVLGGFAAGLGEAFGRAAADGHRLYGFAEHAVTTTFLGSSAGLRLRHDQPSGRFELNAKDAAGSGSAWAGQSTEDFTDTDVLAVQAGLTRRLDWARRQIELPAGRYEVLLPPGAVADLVSYLYRSAGSRDAADGRTVFSKAGGGTRVGAKLASLPLTLRSDPRAPGLECAPFVIVHASSRNSSVFDNGLPLGRTDWISGGALASLVQSRYSAQLSGQPVTPSIDNLILELPGGAGPGNAGGTSSLGDMISATSRGLLLTCLWYIREVDPQTLLLTGLTRDGVYLIEHGEVIGAVNNFRFNESPVALLGRIAEVGATVPARPRDRSDQLTRTAMPPLRVDGFNMSSVSQAS